MLVYGFERNGDLYKTLLLYRNRAVESRYNPITLDEFRDFLISEEGLIVLNMLGIPQVVRLDPNKKTRLGSVLSQHYHQEDCNQNLRNVPLPLRSPYICPVNMQFLGH